MNLNALFVEQAQIVAAIVPVDLETGANNGDWVSMKNYERLTVVVFKAAGTAGDDPVLTMKQAQDVSGTAAKALNFTRVDSKVGAQTGIGDFTTNTQAAANTYTDAVSAEAQGIFVIDFRSSDLDNAGGFDCVQVSIPDTGSAGAEIGSAFYILWGARYQGAGLKSAIVD